MALPFSITAALGHARAPSARIGLDNALGREEAVGPYGERPEGAARGEDAAREAAALACSAEDGARVRLDPTDVIGGALIS